jgi:hypothetical protein
VLVPQGSMPQGAITLNARSHVRSSTDHVQKITIACLIAKHIQKIATQVALP